MTQINLTIDTDKFLEAISAIPWTDTCGNAKKKRFPRSQAIAHFATGVRVRVAVRVWCLYFLKSILIAKS